MRETRREVKQEQGEGFIPTLNEARYAANLAAFARIKRLAGTTPLLVRAISEATGTDDYACQHKSKMWDAWCQAHRRFCDYGETPQAREWGHLASEAAEGLRGLGCTWVPFDVIRSSPELVYIGLVEKYVEHAFKNYVTRYLPEVLRRLQVVEAA